jgi:hypothetical protein
MSHPSQIDERERFKKSACSVPFRIVCQPEVPVKSPEEVLTRHGLKPGQQQQLGAEKAVALVEWYRP